MEPEMCKSLTLLLASLALAPPVSATERFSGSAKLSANSVQTSASGRFSVTAELQAAPAALQISANDRFSLVADLAASKSALTACGPVVDAIFKNGFEN
jgi:hypothetical protein